MGDGSVAPEPSGFDIKGYGAKIRSRGFGVGWVQGLGFGV